MCIADYIATGCKLSSETQYGIIIIIPTNGHPVQHNYVHISSRLLQAVRPVRSLFKSLLLGCKFSYKRRTSDSGYPLHSVELWWMLARCCQKKDGRKNRVVTKFVMYWNITCFQSVKLFFISNIYSSVDTIFDKILYITLYLFVFQVFFTFLIKFPQMIFIFI